MKRVCGIVFKAVRVASCGASARRRVRLRSLKEGSEGGSARERVCEEGMRPLLRSWSAKEDGKRGGHGGRSQV